MNYVSPILRTCGCLLFIRAKTLYSAFISGDTNKTVAIVLSLVEPLLKKGYMLWVDNFYNSPALAQNLKSLNTDCVKILCLNRKDVPKIVKEKELKKGELIAQHSGPVWGTRWCSWLRHCTTSRKVAGSIPNSVIGIFH
jgi:hypothetical protein